MRLSEAFDAYCADVIVFSNQSNKTEENHMVTKKNLISYMGDVEIEDLNFQSIREWKQYLQASRSADTVRNYIIKLRVVLAYLKKQGYKVVDPDLIAVPKRITKAPVCITKEQVTELIYSTPVLRCKLIISLLYASGIRVSELCALNRDQLRNGRFTVTGKGGKSRICFYDQRTAHLLDVYLKTRVDNNPALFYTVQGRIKPGTVQDLFKRLRKRTGIENIHPHTLRHTFATELMQSGMNIYNVSKLLGHTNIQTTSIYLHVTDPHLEAEYEKYHRV